MLKIEKVTKLLEVELAILNNPPKMFLPKKLYHNIIYFKYFKGKIYCGFLSTHLQIPPSVSTIKHSGRTQSFVGLHS